MAPRGVNGDVGCPLLFAVGRWFLALTLPARLRGLLEGSSKGTSSRMCSAYFMWKGSIVQK